MASDENGFVIITGANSGIGLATATQLVHEGKYEVIATCRPGKTNTLSKMNCYTVELDLADETSVKLAAAKIIEISNGKISCLFNNAGYGLQLAMEDTPAGSLRHQLEVNIVGPTLLTNLLLPSMIAFRGSKIIFNSSVLGFLVSPFRGPYCASKYALEAVADAYRLELLGTNTSIVIIEPGPIRASFKLNARTQLELHKDVIAKSRLSYDKLLERLDSQYPARTLSSDHVALQVCKIISTSKPKSRYRITTTSKLGFFLRILPDRLKDYIVSLSEPVRLRQDIDG